LAKAEGRAGCSWFDTLTTSGHVRNVELTTQADEVDVLGIGVEFALDRVVAMRLSVLSLFLTVAVLLPESAPAQAMQFRTPAPEVTAAAAPWQINGEPIVVSGLLYIPTREMRMFDGQVMAQIDVYQRVPIYADTTHEPFTVVYVPVSRDRMRAYERAADSGFAIPSGRGTVPVPLARSAIGAVPEEPSAVGTTGKIVTSPPRMPAASSSPRTRVESIPRPRGINGVWVEFEGGRWFSNGHAMPYSPDRFTRIGEYRGFPVYRDRTSNRDEIWIPSVIGGPVTPYARR
jgi:hypothetical protein